MRIIVKNNPRGKSNNEIIIKATEYFLNELLGSRAKEFGKLSISFKKTANGIGGKAKTQTKNGIKVYQIDINKYESKTEVFRILAHECTHIKQYFLNELTTQYETQFTARGLIRKKVRNWKGKEIRRSIYKKRPWEVEARSNEKLARNIEKKIGIKKSDRKINAKIEIKPVVLNTGTKATIADILKEGAIPNGELVPKILNGDRDKQKTLRILKEVFGLKKGGFIREVIKDSVVWVELV